MNEIKFQAFVLGKMYQVKSLEWTEDGLCITTDGGFITLPDENAHLLQYTGLQDKNGKEIYEGDIVHTFSRVGRGFRDRGVDKIHYSDITARWYPLDIVVTEMCEIIGNIYENPELLEN